MASIKLLHVLIVLILSKDVYGFPNIDFKRRVNILELRTSYRPGSEIVIHEILNKFNRTHETITANCTLSEDFGEKFHVAVDAEICSDGGWKRNLVHIERNNPCTALKFVLGSAWEKFLERGSASAECPVRKGYYELTHYYVDASEVPLIFAAGKFKLYAVLSKNAIAAARVELIVEIIALYT